MSESTKYSSANMCTFFLKFLYIPLNFMSLDVVEALPSDHQKQADSSDPFIFPKLEDYPMGTIPSISVPLNFESHSQEFGSRSITGQGTNLTKLATQSD